MMTQLEILMLFWEEIFSENVIPRSSRGLKKRLKKVKPGSHHKKPVWTMRTLKWYLAWAQRQINGVWTDLATNNITTIYLRDLTPSTTYTFAIVAFDPNGNRLEYTAEIATQDEQNEYARTAHGALAAWTREKAASARA